MTDHQKILLLSSSVNNLNCVIYIIKKSFKDTHREKVPSNKTSALTKSTDMGIWVVGISNQLFRRGSETETKFSKR